MNKLMISMLLLGLAGGEIATAKPRPAPKGTPATPSVISDASISPAPSTPATPWLSWLLEQDGMASAISLAWPEMMQAVSRHQTTPFKPSDPTDAAVAARIGSVMDGLLPRLNRPEGPVRSAKRLALVPPLVEDEALTAFAGMPGLSCEPADGKEPARLGDPATATYPAFKLVDQASHRTCYLSISFYPTGQRESAAPLLRLDPKATAARVPADGTCLLLLLEHNNKSGAELAFLNWELVDLARGKVRVQTSFQATANEILLPAASITDGRRGRD